MLSKNKKTIVNRIKYRKYDSNIPILNILSCFSISSLLLLGIVCINPSMVSISKTYAMDGRSGDVGDSGNSSNDENGSDDSVMPLADLTSDGVTLVWNSSDDPVQSTYGDSSNVLYRYNRFTITADNIKQYQILANVTDSANGSSGNSLIGYTSSDSTTMNGSTVDAISITNGITGSSMQSSTNSQWGYAITEGNVTTETQLSTLTYKAVPAASSSAIAYSKTTTSLNNQPFTIV